MPRSATRPKDDAAIRRAHLSFRAAEESGEGVLDEHEIGAALRAQGLAVPADLGAGSWLKVPPALVDDSDPRMRPPGSSKAQFAPTDPQAPS